MANWYQLMTLQYGFVMDVDHAIAQPGTDVIAYTPWSPPRPNQLWTFEPGPETSPGFYYIKSNLDANLVLDVYEGGHQPGKPLHFLALYAPNSPHSPNQLWKFVPFFPGFPGPGFIQSLLAPNLVADVTGGRRATPGTLLEAWPQDNPTSANQLWWLLADRGNTYQPYISSIAPAGLGFTITGKGFQAGTSVLATYSYSIETGTTQTEYNSFTAITDLGGNFVSQCRLSDLNISSSGTLQININLSVPEFPNYIVATWDGSTFTIIQQ